MKLKKILLLPIGLVLGIAGCANMPFSTYHMATTSFGYDSRYASSSVAANGRVIGGGFGGGIYTNNIKVGPQIITWKDAATGQRHKSKNEVVIHREQLKGKEYIAFHLYPDDTVEVTTSNHWPRPTEKGKTWLEQLEKEQEKKGNKQMNLVSLQRTLATNQDVCNEKLSAKQDCSDIVNISIFFDGTGNNYEADTAKKKWANPARLWRNAIIHKDQNKKTSKGLCCINLTWKAYSAI